MSFTYTLILATAFTPFSLAARAPPNRISSRVAGGSLAQPGEFPFVVAPQRNGNQWCGATLLNAYTVLSAGHCTILVPPESLTVRAGSTHWETGGTVSNITEVRIHPQYRAVVGQYDIALWHLETPIHSSETISYAKIVAQSYDPPVGLKATVVGWGKSTENQTTRASTDLRRVNIPITAREDCNNIYGHTTASELCAGGEEGKGSCPNDSGSPIFNAETHEILGTVHSGGGCGLKDLPVVYTNLGNMSDWILQNIWST